MSIDPGDGDNGECILLSKLSSFKPITEDDLRLIMKESGISTSVEGSISAKLFKASLDIVVPVLAKLMNKKRVC